MKFRLGCARRGAPAPTGGVFDCRAGPALRFPSCKNGSEKRSSIRRSARGPSRLRKRGTTWSSSTFHALQIRQRPRPRPRSEAFRLGIARRLRATALPSAIGGSPPCAKSRAHDPDEEHAIEMARRRRRGDRLSSSGCQSRQLMKADKTPCRRHLAPWRDIRTTVINAAP